MPPCYKIASCRSRMDSVRTLWMTFAFHSPMLGSMGEMKRAIARENEDRQRDRFFSALGIGAAISAAVRLARDDISKPSPRLFAAVADSVGLARMILRRVVGVGN